MRLIKKVNGDVLHLLLVDHTKMFVVDIILIEGLGPVGRRHSCRERDGVFSRCLLPLSGDLTSDLWSENHR